MTLINDFDWLARWNLYCPNQPAIIDGDLNTTLTYRGLYELTLKFSLHLKELNIQEGDRVAVLSTNEPEYVALFFALQRLGAILVPINYRLTANEINYLIENSSSQLLIYHPDFLTIASQLVVPIKKITLVGPNSFTENSLNARPLTQSFIGNENHCSMILYTSGTTGFPKGAMISNKQIFWNSLNTTLRLNLTQSDRAVIFLPLFHTGGWHVLTTPFLHRGSTIILTRKFDPQQILQLTESNRATLLFGVPTTMEMMSRTEVFSTVALDSLRYAIVGGEPMPTQAIELWHKKGVPIRQGYGLTEFGPNVFSLNEEDSLRKIGSIGFPNFYIQAEIFKDDGTCAAAHEIGELALRGPCCMLGYWNNPTATAETIRDGWLLTGDLVLKDEDGYFYVMGRKKEMYKSGGENIYPVEIENILRKHPSIVEAAVIGVPDPKWGEVGKACLVLKQNYIFDEDEFRSFCRQYLAGFKIPKYFQIFDSLPKGDSGKIIKKSLL